MSRFPGGVLCAAASVLLLLCAPHLSARESAAAGLCSAATALVLLPAPWPQNLSRGSPCEKAVKRTPSPVRG